MTLRGGLGTVRRYCLKPLSFARYPDDYCSDMVTQLLKRSALSTRTLLATVLTYHYSIRNFRNSSEPIGVRMSRGRTCRMLRHAVDFEVV